MALVATATSIRVCTIEVREVTLDHLFGWTCCYLFVMLFPTSCQSPLCDFMLIFKSLVQCSNCSSFYSLNVLIPIWPG